MVVREKSFDSRIQESGRSLGRGSGRREPLSELFYQLREEVMGKKRKWSYNYGAECYLLFWPFQEQIERSGWRRGRSESWFRLLRRSFGKEKRRNVSRIPAENRPLNKPVYFEVISIIKLFHITEHPFLFLSRCLFQPPPDFPIPALSFGREGGCVETLSSYRPHI